jgi:glutamate-1-semialdehyde 2,1-aminomutase
MRHFHAAQSKNNISKCHILRDLRNNLVSYQSYDSTSLKKLLEQTSKSNVLFERAKRLYPSGTTRSPYYFSPHPLYMAKGDGCFIWDVDGNKYLDFTNNMGPLILGHRHPEVQKAVAKQLDAFWSGSPTELDLELAETILKAFPMADKLLFTPTGTEADMKLIRAARARKRKKGILVSTGSYHGASDSVMPGPGVPEDTTRLVRHFRYNDEESFIAAFHEAKEDLSAVILEGVLGSAGSVPPTESFLRTVREETSKQGVALLIDEVVTGFRLRRGGVSELYGIDPDGIALGKIIGGGFPVGAFLGNEELMGEFEFPSSEFPFVGKPNILHAGTFNAHPVSMAAGLATLNQLNSEAYQHLDELGERIRNSLSKMCEEQGIEHCVTGKGSIFRLHFSSAKIVDYESTTRYSDERKERVFDSLMLARGVFLPSFHSAFCSLPMGNVELKLFEEAAREALEETIALTKTS